jgi:hypothetical protein
VAWTKKRPTSDYVVNKANAYDKEKGFLSDPNFTAAERAAILQTKHNVTIAEDYSEKATGGGTALREAELFAKESVVQAQDDLLYETLADKVFLLTLAEVRDYLAARNYPITGQLTAQAAARNATSGKLSAGEVWPYWLLSPNFKDGSAVYTVGTYDSSLVGKNVKGSFESTTPAKKDDVGVRPAIYVNPAALVLTAGTGHQTTPYAASADTALSTAPSATPSPALTAGGAPKFTDVKASDWYYDYVVRAYSLSLMKGTSETLFEPDVGLTVAELLTACLNLLDIHVEVSAGGNWYDPYLAEAEARGLITKQDGFYGRPEDFVTRAETAAVLVRAVAVLGASYVVAEDYGWVERVFPDVFDIPEQYRDAVYQAYASGILKGNAEGVFRPQDGLLRCEAATIMCRVHDKDFELPARV